MGQLDNFNLAELGTFIGIVASALAGVLLATQKSKCQTCCWGCIRRDVSAVLAEERLQMTGHTGETPRVTKRDDIELNIIDKNEEILSNKNKIDGE
tara:strand:- start:356 stop:643 length:288 start_codon:yes stop_codon:yes gene_type:complete